jgi:putative transposase
MTMLLLKLLLIAEDGAHQRKIYKTRNEAKAEVCNYIELFYNPSRRYGNNDGISPVQFEK